MYGSRFICLRVVVLFIELLAIYLVYYLLFDPILGQILLIINY